MRLFPFVCRSIEELRIANGGRGGGFGKTHTQPKRKILVQIAVALLVTHSSRFHINPFG